MAGGTRGEVARVAVAITALTVLVTRPLVWQMASALPGNLGDPLLNTFILGWDASRMPRGFDGVWSPPFFFPLRDTLAFSEHLLGVAVFTAPVVWLTGNPLLAYNLAFLGSYVLAGVGMYLLARSLWGRKDAAFLAALAFAFAPHRVMHVPHLQVLTSGWMPLSLWGLHRYFEAGSRRSLAVFAGAFALLALSNGYFLYFFAVPVAIVAIGELARTWVTGSGPARGRAGWRGVLALVSAALAVAAAIAPAAMAYVRVRRAFGLRRDIGEMVAYGARWSDYLRIPDDLWLWMGTLRVGDGERMLFPGWRSSLSRRRRCPRCGAPGGPPLRPAQPAGRGMWVSTRSCWRWPSGSRRVQRCPARTRCSCSSCPASMGSGCRRVSSSSWRSRSACSARQVPHGYSAGFGLAPRRLRPSPWGARSCWRVTAARCTWRRSTMISGRVRF